MKITFRQIGQQQTNIRLDHYLVEKYPAYSRAFLKRQINKGGILVNETIKKPSYILKENDRIDIDVAVPEKYVLQADPTIKLSVIYKDENMVVIDKSAGISVHPSSASGRQKDTIANALLAYYPETKDVGDAPKIRPGIVHRLDKETSGLMVVAKNKQSFEWLKKQFSERRVVKKYLTLIHGQPKKNRGTISKAIGKTKDFRKRTIVPLKDQKEALTYYKTIETFNDYSLIEAEPKTGRTHQIRIHLASIGHPVVGDKLYSFKNHIPPEGLKRQFLHAYYLKFSLPSGKIIELQSDLPEDLKTVIDSLGALN